MERPFLSVQDVANLLGLTKNRVYQLIAQREIPFARVGGTIRIPAEAWERWLSEKNAEAISAVSVATSGSKVAASV